MYVRGYLQGSENGRVVTIDNDAHTLHWKTTKYVQEELAVLRTPSEPSHVTLVSNQ